MANNLTFSQSQLDTLQLLVDQYTEQFPNNDNTSISPLLKRAYDDINAWIQAAAPGSVDSETQLFFRLAVDVNQNVSTSPANLYIRTATLKGLEKTPGGDFSDPAIQRTSNQIALSIFQDLLNDHGLTTAIDNLIRLDVTGAIRDGGQTWGGWAGALFYMTPRVGRQGQSIAKQIFSDPIETAKFEFATIEAADLTRKQFGYTNEFVQALKQATFSDYSAILGSESDLNEAQKKVAVNTLTEIVLNIVSRVFAADPGTLQSELPNWIPFDQLAATSNMAPSRGNILVKANDSVAVQTAISDSTALEDLAKLLPIGAIVVQTEDQTSVAWFGTDRANQLAGTQAIDTMFGGDGADLLNGGSGNDVLKGGLGADTYIFTNGDGQDEISDEDGHGLLIRDGAAIALGVKQDDTHWSLGSVSFTKTGDTTLDVAFTDNATDKITIDNFNFAAAQQGDGYLGIHLKDSSTPVSTVRDIVGDFELQEFTSVVDALPGGFGDSEPVFDGPGIFHFEATRGSFPQLPQEWVVPHAISNDRHLVGSNTNPDTGIRTDLYEIDHYTIVYTLGDDLDNGILDTGRPAPGRADGLRDSAGNDHIMSGGGPDEIDFSGDFTTASSASNGRGGNDWIEAGEGRDRVYSGAGNDLIEGGSGGIADNPGFGEFDVPGGDLLHGGAGNDRIFGDTQIELSAAIDAGNTQLGTGARGDFISGQAGDDILVAGAGNDLLAGGTGADLIIAGAGDDNVLGDADWAAFAMGWFYHDEPAAPGERTASRVFQFFLGDINPVNGGADTIYAGDGTEDVRVLACAGYAQFRPLPLSGEERGEGDQMNSKTMSLKLGGARVLAAALILGFSGICHADEVTKVIDVRCTPSTVQIVPFFVFDVATSGSDWKDIEQRKVVRRGQDTFYLGENTVQAKCVVQGKVVAIRVQYSAPSPKGTCGGNPPGLLAITEDGRPVVSGEIVHECTGSQHAAFRFDSMHGWQRCITPGTAPDLRADDEKSCTALSTSK